jgi:ribosomal protein L37AE/L43A
VIIPIRHNYSMKYTKEQRQHSKCIVCQKDLGEQSKREQWKRFNCFECGERANSLAVLENISFGEALELIKDA